MRHALERRRRILRIRMLGVSRRYTVRPVDLRRGRDRRGLPCPGNNARFGNKLTIAFRIMELVGERVELSPQVGD
jgi:hypothetical protein